MFPGNPDVNCVHVTIPGLFPPARLFFDQESLDVFIEMVKETCPDPKHTNVHFISIAPDGDIISEGHCDVIHLMQDVSYA